MSVIEGQKGKKSASMPEDTLKSKAFLQLIDVVSEGPIESIDEILLNRTPISNITEAVSQTRLGLPDDAPLNGFNSTESFVSVGTEVSHVTGEVIRTINDQTLDAIKVYMGLNVIYRIDSKGAMKTADSGWRIDIKPAGGVWTEVITQDLNAQKATSPVQFEHNIPLTGTGPWDIRVRPRFTAAREKHEENIQWTGYATVVNGKQTYPHSALVGLTLSAEHVGSSMPTRHYRGKWRKILVPTNYNPITRVYTGVWDGTFKRAWSNCPPWILYDMAENNIFGLGNHIDITTINKWKLYTIAQYCDQLVPTGYKDANGVATYEPRYTFNGVITNKQQALDAFRSITAVWRGMGFYGLSQLYTTVDMPQDPAFVYGPSNVVDGRFEYSSSSVKARHSVVLVRFNDPNNLFEPAIEPVIDDEAVADPSIGWREKTLELAGCSSRSLANRYGRWVIETEKSETETVTFAVSLDSIHAFPGEVIAVSDPRRVRARLSGRVISRNATGSVITLDKPVPDSITGTVKLRIQKSDGTLLTITGTIGANRSNISVTLANRPDVVSFVRENSVYILSSSTVEARMFRIVSIEEEPSSGAEAVLFRITALQYDSTKFARVENGIHFDPIPVMVDMPVAKPPTNFLAEVRTYTDGGQIRNDIELKWSPPSGVMVKEYRVFVTTPSLAVVPLGATSQSSLTYTTYEPGLHKFSIASVSYLGGLSDPLLGEFTVAGLTAINIGSVADFVNAATLLGGTTTFSGSDVRVSWRNMMNVSSVSGVAAVDSDDAAYSHTNLEFYFGATKVRTQRVKGNSFIYTLDMNKADAATIGLTDAQRSIKINAYIVDKAGRSSPSSIINLTNGAPAAIAPTVTPEGKFLNITWPVSTDTDTTGYLVFVRATNGSVVGVNPTAVVTANSYRFEGAFSTGYYVTVVGYDAFGRNGLNYATPLLASTSADTVDYAAPATPTGLALSSSLTATGAKLVATWTANTEPDMLGYEVTIREGVSGDISFTTPTNRHEWAVISGLTYTVKVRALDKSSNRSNYTAEASHVAVTDTVAPATPVGLAVTAGFNAIWLSWTANAEADLSFYEVAEAAATFTAAAAVVSYSSASATVARTGLGDGVQRFFRVRAVDTSGNRSGWSAIVNATTTTLDLNTGAPPVPTGLAASSALGGAAQAAITATWNAAAGAVSYELGVTASGGNEVTQYSGLTSLTFGSLPGVVFSLRVRSVGETGKKSAWSTAVPITAAADSVAPAVPVSLTATGGFGTILLKWTANTEADLDAYQIYESTTVTAPVAGTAATYVSAANTLALTGLSEGLTRNYWVRAVDTSGNKSAWSAMVSATTASLGSTQSSSPAPTGLALTTESSPQADGSFISLIRATWVASSNAVSYEVSVTRSGASEQILATGGLSVEFAAVADLSHSIKVRSVNNVGAKSAWSGISSITSASDAVAPATPTGLTATGGFEGIWLKMNRNTEADFSFYEVYESATTTAPLAGTAATFTTASESMARTNLTGAAKTRNYWVRAVDTSGNKSAWSAMVSATTTVIDTSITTAKLEGLLDATSFASGIKPVEVLAALPGSPHVKGRQVFLTTDDKLYRNTGTGWTKATDGADIVADSITAGSIAAGAIKTAQLDAGAVVASKMLIGDTSNIINDPDCVDVAAWSLTGGTVISVVATAANIASKNLVFSDATTTDQVIYSSIFPVEPNKPLWVSGYIGRHSGDAVAQNYELAVEFFSNQAGTTTLGETLVGSYTGIASGTRSGQITAPATGRRARLVARKIASAGALVALRLGAPVVRRATNGELIVDGSLTAAHVGTNEIIANTANIKDAVITNAKIFDLSAAKITANTALAGSITVSSRALSDINDDAALGAQNPATRINTGVTNIDPGKIVVSGATTLADWRGVSDTTTINGGKIETDSVSARSIKVGLLQNLVQNGDFLDTSAPPSVNWTVTGGTLAWDTTNTYKGSASLRATKATAGSATPFYTPASKRIPVVPGEVFSVMCAVKADAAAALGFYMRLNWYDAAGVLITQVYDPATENKPLTTDWVIFESQRTAPPLAATAEFRLVNNSNQTTALVLYVGQASVKRASGTIEISDGAITGAKLIKTENVVTLGAQIKNAIITDAHITELSATKLTVGSALAGSITVSSRALSAINADAALGAQDPTTRINAGSTTIDPGKIVISGATTLANWRGSTDTTTINGGAIETDSISARAIKIGLLQNLVQNGDFSDTSVLPSSYWQSSAGSLAWDTTETYMGSPSLRATKNVAGSSHIIYSTVAKRIPVVGGETVSLSAVVKANAATAVGLYARLNWYDAAGVALTPASSGETENKPLTTGWVAHEWQVTVPALAAFAEVRFINHSNQTTATILYIGRVRVQRATGTINIEDGAITGAKLITTENVITLSAQIKDAVITNAKITDLSATKLTANTALAETITVSGTALSSIRSDAQTGAVDPVTRINAGVTQIDPGKIVISGATTLADWRNGTDSTTIEGGKIAANSIKANSLEIGSRNLTVSAIQFEHNSPSANYVSWTAGVIRYINDAGVSTSASISANTTGVLWTSGIIFIYWVKGATALSTTTTQATAFGTNNVILATYQGGTLLVTDYGRTVIDGSSIKTGTVKAAQIDTTSAVITGTAQISDAVITTAKINDAAISTAKIADAAISNAKIGDLQVSTLKIGDNAVTVPVSSMTSAVLNLTLGDQSIASVAINRTGVATRIDFSVAVRAYLGICEFSLYRNSTLLSTFSSVSTSSSDKFTSVSMIFTDVDAGTGSTTYSVKAKMTTDDPWISVKDRYIGVIQFKK